MKWLSLKKVRKLSVAFTVPYILRSAKRTFFVRTDASNSYESWVSDWFSKVSTQLLGMIFQEIFQYIYRYENNDTQMPWYSWIYNNTWTYGTRMPFSYFQQWLFLGLNKLTFTHGYFNAFYCILHVFHRQICLRFQEMSPWQCDNRETFSKLRSFNIISNQLYLNHFWKNTEECGLLLNIWIVNM